MLPAASQPEAELEPPAGPDPLLGKLIAGRLRLMNVIGAGAAGTVYRAHHDALDKDVAVKILHAHRPELARRFRIEARSASRIEHPNTVRILDFGEDNGRLYLTMELLLGETLFDRIKKRRRFPQNEAIEIILQILAATAAAHKEGIVHRDLKPGNVIIVREEDSEGEFFDRIKVCDFGLAKVVDADPEESATAANLIVGTPSYMAPEQASGTKVDPRTDIYACGVILYELLTGEPPFYGTNLADVLVRVMIEEPPPPDLVVPSLDPALVKIVMRALSKAREDRFTSAREMMLALRELLASEVLARPAMPRVPTMISQVSPISIVEAPPTLVSGPPAIAVPTEVIERTAPAASAPKKKLVLAGTAMLAAACGVAFAAFQARPMTEPVAVQDPPVLTRLAPISQTAPIDPPVRAAIEKSEPVEKVEPAPAVVAKKRAPAHRAPVVELSAETVKPIPEPAVEPPPEVPPAVEEKQADVKAEAVATDRGVAEAAPQEEPARDQPSPTPVREEPSRSLPAREAKTKLSALKVTGGLAAPRCAEALGRVMPQVEACIFAALKNDPLQKGGIAVSARIGSDGRLRAIEMTGDANLHGCTELALSSARMPRPDTGEARLTMRIDWWTAP